MSLDKLGLIPDDCKMSIQKGKLQFEQEQYDEAIQHFLEAAKFCKLYAQKTYPLYMLEISSYLASSNLKIFEKHLDSIYHYDEARNYYELSLLIVEQNEEYLVQDYAKKLQVKFLSDRHLLHLYMNNYEAAEGDLKDAQSLLVDIQLQTKDLAYIEFFLGQLYLLIYEESVYAKSKRHFEKALDIMINCSEGVKTDEDFIVTIKHKIEELEESLKDEAPRQIKIYHSQQKTKQITHLGTFGSGQKK